MKCMLLVLAVCLAAFLPACADDGTADQCAPGASQACLTQCNTTGTQVCIQGAFSTCTPPTEICNQKDDNCNGQTDEGSVCGNCTAGTTQGCQTNCGSTGTQTCGAAQTWGACAPPVESCNGKDDDCDGKTDEDNVCSAGECTAGATDQCISTCQTIGTKTCAADGSWAACAPPVETCNALDDNCNGQTDENIVEVCQSQCGEGVKVCSKGLWLDCTAAQPALEECDGLDNDCDGFTDEGMNNNQLSQTCGEECGTGGTKNCVGGVWGVCSLIPLDEVCDGKDNDCDGAIDEVCACENGASQECGLGIGACGKGTQTCTNGAWTSCSGPNFKEPTNEACDGIDNDCDGFVDCEGLSLAVCKLKMADVGTQCGTANTTEFGGASLPCKLGFTFCQAGQIVCTGVDPSPEVCDGVDNDCDGEEDETTGGGDQYEDNDTCNSAFQIGGALQGYSYTVEGPTIHEEGDDDWYVVEYQEASDFWTPEEFEIKITLKNIPPGLDLDLCVWPLNGAVTSTDKTGADKVQPAANSCTPMNAVFADSDYCLDLNIWKLGQDSETYVAKWSGGLGSNDDRTFYVYVFAFGEVDLQCVEPYLLEVEAN